MWRGDVPLFQLPDGRGTQALWQRCDMIVAVLHAEHCALCRTVADALRVADRDGGKVGVVIVPLETASVTVRDTLFAALRPLGVTEGDPCVIVADRFGRLYGSVHAHDREALRDAWAWIDFIQEQCEECGAPVDWA